MNRAGEEVLLNDHLKLLRLPAMLRQYPECARQARETKESHESFLLNLTYDAGTGAETGQSTEAATSRSKVSYAENSGDDRSE